MQQEQDINQPISQQHLPPVDSFRVFMLIKRTAKIKADALRCAIVISQIKTLPNNQQILYLSKKTKFKSKKRPFWKQHFYLDCQKQDSLKIALINEHNNTLAQQNITLNQFLCHYNQQEPLCNFSYTQNLNQLCYDNKKLSPICYIIGAIAIPDLSLAFKQRQYEPTESEMVEKIIFPTLPLLNCFSYMDNNIVAGFDEFQLFPGKFIPTKKQLRQSQS